jgi:hypothetical protein
MRPLLSIALFYQMNRINQELQSHAEGADTCKALLAFPKAGQVFALLVQIRANPNLRKGLAVDKQMAHELRRKPCREAGASSDERHG